MKVEKIVIDPSTDRVVTFWYLGHDTWLCGECGHKIYYVPRNFEGPTHECPNCLSRPWMTQTTLVAGLKRKGKEQC
jgi:DNA-directed RNA polymerase subunit RPC12/RpoP